jgi:hypothetical protein
MCEGFKRGSVNARHQTSQSDQTFYTAVECSCSVTPYTTLKNRLGGRPNRSERGANNHKLTKSEEESLLQWILSMDRRGAAPRSAHVQDMANILLSARGLSNNQPTDKN